jgi:hypothetical protein
MENHACHSNPEKEIESTDYLFSTGGCAKSRKPVCREKASL